MEHNTTPNLSRHAQRRCQQQGVTLETLIALLDHHDLDRDVGRNCRVLRMSRRRARTAGQPFGPQIGRRLERLAVIISDDTGEVITVMHDTGTSWRYRCGG